MDRVIVAFEGEKTRRRFCEILENARVAACLEAGTADEVRRLTARLGVGTVICGYKLREETAQTLFYDLPSGTVMLVVAQKAQLDLLSDDIFTLPAPVSPSDLCVSVSLALQACRRLRRVLRPHRSEAEDDLVSRAKAFLMERDGINEESAHRLLQRKSMDSGMKMAETAAEILNLQSDNKQEDAQHGEDQFQL